MVIQLAQVKKFQESFKQEVNNTPKIPTKSDCDLRYDLAQEELDEYQDAVFNNDIVEVLDSLVDQMYILLGSVNFHGLQDQFLRAFDLVHENNMSKLDENGNVLKNEFGKVIKPKGFKPVDLKQLFETDASFRVEPIKIEE